MLTVNTVHLIRRRLVGSTLCLQLLPNVFALPVRTILDKYAPRISSIAGSVLVVTGAVLLAFAKQPPFDGYLPGYIFFALGGTLIFLPSFQLSNTFRFHTGLAHRRFRFVKRYLPVLPPYIHCIWQQIWAAKVLRHISNYSSSHRFS